MFKLFVDLDGVLADFDRGVQDLTGRPPDQLHPKRMWAAIARADGFYENLRWMEDGKVLWNAVRSNEPTILTGLPMGSWAEPQKRAWCARELGPDIPVITCMSRHKAARAAEHTPENAVMVLVDDREKLRESWEAAGGVFILHTDADSSIAALTEAGVL
ncbi:MAG: hypothetical protein ACOC4I_06030 [Spirochaetota bacterium]